MSQLKYSIQVLAANFCVKFSRDMVLPALPAFALIFGVSLFEIQYSVSIYFFALALSRLFWPMLPDIAWAKRIALGLFIIGCMLSLLAHHYYAFVLARCIQGFASGALPILVRAELFNASGEKTTLKVLSFTGMLTVWSSGIAIGLGSYLLLLSPLAIFVFMMLFALLMLKLPEEASQSETKQTRLSWRIIKNTKILITSGIFALNFAGSAIFYTLVAYWLFEVFKLNTHQFAIANMIMLSGLIIGKLIAGIGGYYIRTQTMLTLASLLAILAGIMLYCSQDQIIIVMLAFTFYFISQGLMIPTTKTQVMVEHPQHPAMAGAILGLFSALLAGISSTLTNYFNLVDFTQVGIIIAVLNLIALILTLWHLVSRQR